MLLSDWRTRMLLACSSLPVTVETVYLHHTGEADDTTLLCFLLSVTCCLLMALLPRIGAWAIVALWVARCVMPGTTPLSVLFCLLMAVTVMAYRDMRIALPAAIVAETATAARIPLYPWDSSTFTMLCATAAFLLLALWLGSMMDRQERRETEERERAGLLRRLADQRLATQLHHSVANDLATILLLARQLASDEKRPDFRTPIPRDSASRASTSRGTGTTTDIADEPDRGIPDDATIDARTVALIERTASESLAKVRALIAGLDRQTGTTDSSGSADAVYAHGTMTGTTLEDAVEVASGPESASGNVTAPRPTTAPTQAGPSSAKPRDLRLTSVTADELRALGESFDERLHAIGLDGETIIGGERSVTCTVERRDVLLEILHEIVGNMMKYADPEAGYCIAITLAPGLATVSESNGVRPDDTHAGDGAGTAQTAANTGADTASSSPLMGGGTGLDRCRRTAADLGGEYAVSGDDGAWTVLLRLPLT
ncbi:hypothetical protein JS528_07560 [Bifidobacterium sp. MA2]|uniref:Signal transduction histidine kinase n=1 Tax=Bifidobacterium santillanense TaxID=2809028 RepID=A0ABS5UQW1_9BIFI|nr:hypothetical protein [Bifidobacterium santillanense]MBT1173209.1 hypothetical protein [Bifidobacterium santillanense]